MKTIIKRLLAQFGTRRHPSPHKTNRPKPTPNREQPKANSQQLTANPPTANREQPTAKGQQPTANPTVLLNLFLTLSSD